MATLWFGSHLTNKQFKSLLKKYNMEYPDDKEDYYDWIRDDLFKQQIEGFSMATYGFCCRDVDGFIIGIKGDGIWSSNGAVKIKKVPNNDKNAVELKLFCQEMGFDEPCLYLVAADCRVCGS
jgi:hypothetical protein